MSRSFSRALSLKIHIWTDSGERTLCKQCSKYFTGTGQLRILMRTHSEGKLYCCKQCSKSFTGSGDLRKHILINSETIFACTQCSKQFSQAGHLKGHMKPFS